MANLTETASFDTNIYRIDQADPVQGWDGSSLGISNAQAQALANRTQYLKTLVDLGSRFTGVIPYNYVGSGGVKTLTPSECNGFLYRLNTTNFDGVLTMPLASTCTDGANIAVIVEPAATLQFKSSNGRYVVLGPSGSDVFFDPETMQTTSNYTINPFTLVRIYKIGSTTWMVVKESAQENAPAGIIAAWAVNAPPYGWIECSGVAISRTTYARLFNNIGTTFGVGNGTTTFNIPDLRGEFIRGWDNARGVDTGRTFGSAQSDDLKAHTHTYRGATIIATGSDPIGTGGNFTTGNTGSTGGTETRPRNIAMMYCIKF